MTNYIWGGASGTMVGRHGPLTKGDVVSLDDAEVASVAGNALWAPKPVTTDKLLIVLDADTTLTNAQTGLRVVNVRTSAAQFTLPAEPTLGVNFEFEFGPGAVGDITVACKGKTIDGAAADLTIAIATDHRCGVYYNGTGWVSYS